MRSSFGSEDEFMQYSWAIASVIVLLTGTCAAGVATLRIRKRSPLGRNIQISTTVAIFVVFLHNVFWEREINEMASKGWTLIYTLPAFSICILLSGVLTIIFAARDRSQLRYESDPPTEPENRKAEHDSGLNGLQP